MIGKNARSLMRHNHGGDVMNQRQSLNGMVNSNVNGSIKAQFILTSLRSGTVPDGLEEWVSKTLEDPVWSSRNIAVKAIRLAQLEQFAPNLCKMVSDPGEIGFIRRNASRALGQMGRTYSETLITLDNALRDSYWEVRATAARSIARISPPDKDREHTIVSLLFKTIPAQGDVLPIWRPGRVYREKNFEVREAMTQALGAVSVTSTAIWALRLLLQDDNWKIRNAGLQTIAVLYDARPLLRNELEQSLKDTDLSSTDFNPLFPIRKTWNGVKDKLDKYTGNNTLGGE
jgi:HEAT repeats